MQDPRSTPPIRGLAIPGNGASRTGSRIADTVRRRHRSCHRGREADTDRRKGPDVAGPSSLTAPNAPLASRLCAHFDLTLREFWALTAAVGAVFGFAALSYCFLFRDPAPGLPLLVAVLVGLVGLALLVIGLSELWAGRDRPFRTDERQ